MIINQVIDGVYETKKMLLEINEIDVSKLFKRCSGYQQRYKHEKNALLRMQHVSNVPRLIKYQDEKTKLVMSRVPGERVTQLSEKNLLDLTIIVNDMLAAGVARHSMPIRDILIDESGNLSLVDFERSTICNQTWRPDWIVAKKVTLYHLSRLTQEHQPQILTSEQKLSLESADNIQGVLKVVKRIRKYVRKKLFS